MKREKGRDNERFIEWWRLRFEEKTPTDWARFWFEKLSRFHQIKNPEGREFSEGDVVAFLRDKLRVSVPAWKRLFGKACSNSSNP